MACVTLNVVTPTVPTPTPTPTPTIPTAPAIPTWAWILAGVAVAGGIGYMLAKKRR
jgi:LPXTG-motif cell wall-anchored protein